MADRANEHDHELVTPQLLRRWRLPSPTGGKESRGRILIGGGSAEVPGAVLLAAEDVDRVRELADGASAVLIGPGMKDVE